MQWSSRVVSPYVLLRTVSTPAESHMKRNRTLFLIFHYCLRGMYCSRGCTVSHITNNMIERVRNCQRKVLYVQYCTKSVMKCLQYSLQYYYESIIVIHNIQHTGTTVWHWLSTVLLHCHVQGDCVHSLWHDDDRRVQYLSQQGPGRDGRREKKLLNFKTFEFIFKL